MKLGLFLFGLICLFALFSSPFANDIHLQEQNLSPSLLHPFGTDELGRDLFTKVAFATRISLFIGLSAAFIDTLLGIIFGLIAAKNHQIVRLFDALASIPSLLFCIFLTSILGNGLITVLIAMTCTGWIPMARIVRGEILHLSQADFVFAAKALGASHFRLFFYHLLPNAAHPVITTLTLTIPLAIFTESFLSFLGIGVRIPMPSLGTMVSDGASAMLYYPWRLFFPSLILSSLILSLNLIGSSLRKKNA